MTINNTANKVVAAGNGVMTVFNFSFVGVEASDIEVIYTNASGVETTLAPSQYALVLNAAPPGQIWGIGGTVTYPLVGSPIALNTSLTIVRTVPLLQEVALGNQGNEFPSAVETALDLIVMMVQQGSETDQRAIVVPIVDPPTIGVTLPPAAQRANQALIFDGSGNVAAGAIPASGVISTAMQPVVDASTLAIGRAAFGLGNVAVENIGSGLSDDGAGNLRVNMPINQVASNQTVTAAFDLERYIATGPLNFTLPRANTLWNGFGFWVQAVSGDVTLIPNAADQVNGTLASGAAFTIPAGASVFVTTDAGSSGNWYVNGIPWLVQEPRSVSGTYDISASDNAKILNHDSGAFGTFIFPSGSTLPANFRCVIMNGETTPIGKGIGGTNLGPFRMYPGQAYTVINNAGTVTVLGGKQLYVVSGVAVYQSLTGSDNPLVSDGLSTGARANLTAANTYAQFKEDFDHNGSGSASINMGAGTIQESIVFSGQPINCPVWFLNGPSALGTTWQPAGAGTPYCWIIGDSVVMEYSNILLDGSNLGATNSTGIQRHQVGVADQNSGCGFGSFGSTSGAHVAFDGIGATHNINASYAVNGAGGAAAHHNDTAAAFVNITGSITVTITNTPNIGKWFGLFGSGANISLGSSITFAGSILSGGEKWSCGPAGVLSLGGNGANIPGTIAGNPAAGSAPTAATGWVNA